MSLPTQKRIGIEASECLTALGDSKATCAALIRGEVALRALPVLGKDGGDPVPLATSLNYDEEVPPRWQAQVDDLAARLPASPWGSVSHPVFVTSSNYDVGSLYAYRNTGNPDFLKIGTPANCLSYLKRRYGWGNHVHALSHACVSGQLGIEMAARYLQRGGAQQALVFSFDYISPFVAGGFHALKILNEQFPAPYQDREFGSIGLGDGCGFVVLSQQDTPVRIESNFLYNEMYHFTSNDPGGSGFRACADWLNTFAGGRRTWLKGHGTGTLDAGRLEAEVFAAAFPASPLVSWKGSLGHTLGSCAVVELAITLEAIRRGQAPGTVGSAAPTMAANVALSPISTAAFDAVALFCNAFGGAHAACLLSYD